MKKLLSILLFVPVLAFAQRIPLYNTNTLFLTPSNLFASNIISGPAIQLTKGANGQLTLTVSNASVADAMLADMTATSLEGRSANSTGVRAAIQASANGQGFYRSNSLLSAGKLGFTNDYVYNVNPVGQSANQVLAWDGISLIWTNKNPGIWLNGVATNLNTYADSTTVIPLTANGFAATATNVMQVKHAGGAIVSRVETNGFWLAAYDVIFTNVTTDASLTTIGQIAMPDNSVWVVEAWATAYSPGLTNVAGYKRAGIFSCTNSVSRLVGALAATHAFSGEDQSAWDFTMGINAPNLVRFQATGAVNQTNKWTVIARMTQQLW